MSITITLFYCNKAMQPKKYSLSWHTYSDHLKSMMKELMMNEHFSDVTLVTEDKKQIKANINILSDELESIMQFIYLGEATFYEERMSEVLAVAKLLEIKGLCNAGAESNDDPDEYHSQNDPDTQTDDRMDEVLDGTESNDYPYDYPSSNDPDTPTEFVEEKSELFDNIKNQAPQERKESTGAYECDQCYTPYSSPGVLNAHKQSIHQGVSNTSLYWELHSIKGGVRLLAGSGFCLLSTPQERHILARLISTEEEKIESEEEFKCQCCNSFESANRFASLTILRESTKILHSCPLL